MAGGKKGAGAAAEAGKKSSAKVSSSQRARLVFPPVKFQRLLRRGRHAQRISSNCGIFLAGSMEWLVQEILDCMMQAAKKSKSGMLHPRHIMSAIRGDEELSVVFNNIVIMKGGMGSSQLSIDSCFGGASKLAYKKKSSSSKKAAGSQNEKDNIAENCSPMNDDDGEDQESSDSSGSGDENVSLNHNHNHNDSQEY
eukprot:Gregarina_sp_Poly_1__11405@NODE_96_length_14647_cov_152_270302_g83_i0_p9_GENE_NODE_96_length_14647_cov_152_270302_g83_i0NODE_96_length_14647_cov_152_270302_g83_i0_p9_ORF_typecomplete_len196_score31_87Histone/PF00125_24/3_6e07Histone/PF00125_24/4_8e03CBFD_NFYB_HMF/PF00808_23/0_012FdtA/PF05523_11/0_13_NODE_96_length_14647_cov_152_270302_g83_i062786865